MLRIGLRNANKPASAGHVRNDAGRSLAHHVRHHSPAQRSGDAGCGRVLQRPQGVVVDSPHSLAAIVCLTAEERHDKVLREEVRFSQDIFGT